MSSLLSQNKTNLQEILTSVNSLPNAPDGGTQVTPVISVNSSNGLITATAGAKISTYQLAFQPAKTITPSTSNQIAVSKGYFTGGSVTVKGDSNLLASNIKNGVSIFGVNGTYAGVYSGIEDAIITRTMSGDFTDSSITSIGSYAFYGCAELSTINCPAVSYIGAVAFCSCYNLASINFPMVQSLYNSTFKACSMLTETAFPQASTMSASVFYSCVRLQSLYLLGSSICTLTNSNAFASTPIGGYSSVAGTYGSIYVPASLVASYQAATNWTYFSSRFVAYNEVTNTISFTINNTEYQAENGMTWAEWVDSEYNTVGWYCSDSGDITYWESSTIVHMINNVGPSDTIIADKSYSVYTEFWDDFT